LQGIQGIKGDKGDTGDTGPAGADGADGLDGTDGEDGLAATIAVGTVTTGTPLSITNSGTSSAAVFDFVIPSGGGSYSPLDQRTNGFEYYNDFYTATLTAHPIAISTSGTTNNTIQSDANAGFNTLGTMRRTATSAGSRIGLNSTISLYTSSTIQTVQYRIKLNQLSTPTERFVYRVGFTNGWTQNYWTTTQAVFVYDNHVANAWPNNSVTASQNWQIAEGLTGDNGADMVAFDTGIPVDLNWHTFRIDFIPTTYNPSNSTTVGSTTLNYYIDDVLVRTVTKNVQTGRYIFTPGDVFNKLVGTTALTFDTDYMYFKQKPNFTR